MGTFILSLRYTGSLEDIDAVLPDHAAWLKGNHEAGHFLGWGRKIPREGGVILARGESAEAVAALAASDPFARAGLATVEVIEWAPAFLDPSVAGLQP
ncbi:YciI family protein [Novosphingobium sp. 1949]|uniref:YciI family protein n=1 Tax=Novosphingobium organovorum TaxID=2930092 RepID=A0ABT0BF96_9SPHN|nr:YciI family protein [Novosphingobium organovorum]MCJ2183745.1 YciI family protein [Novosphingobium organovorum]